MISAAVLTAALLIAPPPRQLQISSERGVQRIALRIEPGLGALVPLPPLVRAIGGTVASDPPWLTWRTNVGQFRFLAGTALVDDGNGVRPLPAPVLSRGDTLFIPLAFVAEVLADPVRKAWTWNASSATLAAGATVSPLVARPEPARVPATTASAGEAAGTGLRPGHRVTIDPGHGGTDPGNPGMFFPDGLKEAHVTLAVSLLVREELQRLGVNVTMTRITDTLINLGHRAPRFCRDDCDLFVSIHVNDLPKRGNYTAVRGFETYFQAEARTADAARVAAMENEAIRYEVPDVQEEAQGLAFILRDLQTNEFLRESGRAAELVQAALGEVHDGVDRGVKQANFAVLNTARRPAILVELGFATNREDARLMTTATGQRSLARAIAGAIVSYLREFDRRSGAAAPEGP
jgi:N-acetylmuramoyl-L-alanine amidase